MTNISEEIAFLDFAVEYLGWAQRCQSGFVAWRLHHPDKIWKAVKDAVLASDGPDAVAELAAKTKSQPADSRWPFLKSQLSDKALSRIVGKMRLLHKQSPGVVLPDLAIPLKPEDVEELVAIIVAAREGDDEQVAIEILESLTPDEQAQVIEAMQLVA